MASNRFLSVEDAVSHLKRTALPTLIVEGGSDAIVLRRLEDLISDLGLSVLPVGGRDTALEIFRRRGEFTTDVLYFVDQDCWIYTGVPAEFDDSKLGCTHGYSIENDMFQDGELITLLTEAERTKFGQELNHFLPWFTNRVEEVLGGAVPNFAAHPNTILSHPPEFANDNALLADLLANFDRKVRGHSLFALLMRRFAGRWPKYSYDNLLEIAAARSGPNLSRIATWVRSELAA